jgi:hypothetical protein
MLVDNHPLKTADALQLVAAFTWCAGQTQDGSSFAWIEGCVMPRGSKALPSCRKDVAMGASLFFSVRLPTTYLPGYAGLRWPS